MEAVKIVEIGGEGGSICLFGARDGQQWHFWRGTDETTLLDLGADVSDGPFVSRSQKAADWDEGLQLLDRYAWVNLFPLYVHRDFADRVLDAVKARSRNGRVPSNWARVCMPSCLAASGPWLC